VVRVHTQPILARITAHYKAKRRACSMRFLDA
jgi:hypothetical protein